MKYYVVVEWTLDERLVPAPGVPHIEVFGYFDDEVTAGKYKHDLDSKFPDMEHDVHEVQSPNQGLCIAEPK